LVVAVLDPANGAEHLREWGETAVAIVTAGRSTDAKLAANATMIRSAGLRLASVVLVDSDPLDDTLGVVPGRPDSGQTNTPNPPSARSRWVVSSA
jgi:hypothetical protein